MKTNKEWFSASRSGMKSIQLSKPKFYAIREIIANCFDEEITICHMDSFWKGSVAKFCIEDNSPTGFRDLADAFTLFKECYKRPDVTKRGRWNFGEKQAFAICERASIETTTGTVTFDRQGRHENLRKKRSKGTKVEMDIRMTKAEYDEILTYVELLIIPKHIIFNLNGREIYHEQPIKELEDTLMTECLNGEHMSKTQRKTAIKLYQPCLKSYLYELGIPITEIVCKYSIDVNQRVPMSSDRDTVSQAYLQDLFAIVLNATHNDLKPEESSALWVRDGMSDERVNKDAVQQVIRQRYGDKVVVATPNDPISVDDAIANGYRCITGAELSGAEWDSVKRYDSISSSHELFGHTSVAGESVEPTESMKAVDELAKKIMLRVFNIKISVRFAKWDGIPAQFGDDVLTFNVKSLGKSWFNDSNFVNIIDTLLHELPHHYGHHTEAIYHQKITMLSANLIKIALEEPEFYRRN